MSEEIKKVLTSREISNLNLKRKPRIGKNKLTIASKNAILVLATCLNKQQLKQKAIDLWDKRPEIAFTILSKTLPKDINITKHEIKDNRILIMLQSLNNNNGIQ